MTANFSQTAAYIWSLADLLRGDFKQSQYGRVILPFTILRRLECVLEISKPKVLASAQISAYNTVRISGFTSDLHSSSPLVWPTPTS